MKLHAIDRRWIFLFMLIGVMVPLFVPLGLSVEPTPNVKMVYDLVDAAKPGDRIILSFDFDPSSGPEIMPAAIALVKQALEKDLRIVCMSLWPMGVSLTEEVYLYHKEKLVYGENFINLGYKVGGLVAIKAMGNDFKEVFPTDTGGRNINSFPIMEGVHNFSDFYMVASLSSGTPGMTEWIQVAGDNYGLAVTGSTTAVSTPGFTPYINKQKQLHGLIGGLKAAAEYEKLIGAPAKATSGMDAQSIAHLIIILFIVIGNISWHLSKRKKSEKGA